MAYVTRDAQGQIINVTRWPHEGWQQQLPHDDPEIVAFREAILAEPTDGERIDRALQFNPFLRGLLRVLAQRFKITPAELLAEIKSNT